MAKILPALSEIYYRSSHRPWEDSYGMVRMTPHSWYVGDTWLGVVLIETNDGIVMIDSGIHGQMWLIFESLRKLGYDPQKDIKLVLLSHAHPDHCSGMALLQNYAHPVVYMSPFEKDWSWDMSYHTRVPERVDIVQPFTYDYLYDYKTPIEHGGFTFKVLHTPGHTPGTSSIFFEDHDDEGNVYRVGLHGGMGTNTMVDSNFTTGEEAERERKAFRAMMEGLKGMPIDITITNHAGNIKMSERMGEDKTDWRPFVDPAFWDAHIDVILAQLDQIEEETCFR
ncbi:MAG: MBL fold metallo-hydrolase [Oscillospiraceae bacterium]|nr:MBL fold metallo-hydrolase [Oscillospiraceae bacterium]